MVAVIAVLTLSSGQVCGAYELFLQINDLQGESDRPGHENWIDVDSFGVSASTVVGGGRGSAEFSPFRFRGPISKASPKILEFVVTGAIRETVRLDITMATDPTKVVAYWELEDVQFTSYESGGTMSSDWTVPWDMYMAVCPEGRYGYTEYDADGFPAGTVEMRWGPAAPASVVTTGTVSGFQFITGDLAPEPATLSLLALGAVAGLLRRRR